MALALVAGAVAGSGALFFRWCIEVVQVRFLPGGRIGNYEALAPGWRLWLPVTGGILLGWIWDRLPPPQRLVGVTHVLDRLHSHAGERLPLANFLAQFAGGIVAIASGHSVDREGPGVHVGAASASLLGQAAHLSAEDDYTMTTCGAAAAIAAAFNTPLAGVLFVIEVLGVRYGVSRFVPVTAAAVVGAVLAQGFYGPAPAFLVPPVRLGSLSGLPTIALMGVITGLIAAAFVRSVAWMGERTRDWPHVASFGLAGIATGVLGWWVPQIMGLSYDTLNLFLAGEAGVAVLLAVLAAKFVATAVGVALRVPGGLIGPALLMGAALGGLTGVAAQWLHGSAIGSIGFFAMVGMVAMMGSVLRAPLAALAALLELTANPNILLPGMVAVVSADLANRLSLDQPSAFQVLRGSRTAAAEAADDPREAGEEPGRPPA